MFKISNVEEFSKEYPEFVNRFFNFYGSYELHGFGSYNGCELKMGSTMDGLHQLTPIWKKIFTGTDSQYFIFFNQARSTWELHEATTYNGLTSSVTVPHLDCKTGSTSQFSLFYINFR